MLRRDGACEQRGRFSATTAAGTRPARCSAPAPGRRSTAARRCWQAGGFDERFFAYLEDVDLALRLRLAGWRCRYEPAVARHAGEGSSHHWPAGHQPWSTRNTLLLVGKRFPARWLPLVAYRQLAWAWHAARGGGWERTCAGGGRAAQASARTCPARAAAGGR